MPNGNVNKINKWSNDELYQQEVVFVDGMMIHIII